MSPVAITEKNRFSTFVRSKYDPKYQALVSWEQWFNQRGIRAIIASTSNGYAVYREGLIKVDIKD